MKLVSPLSADLERAPDAGHTVREYVAAIWQRKGLVLLLAVLGAAAGWWQGKRSPDVYAVSTLVDIQKPKPFAGAAPTQAFGESYHESQLYYPTKWSLLSSGTYVERLFASVSGPQGRRYPMWDWLTWSVYLDQKPDAAREAFGPEVADIVAFEALVGIPAREFQRRYSFRRYGLHPSPSARYDDPSDLAGYLATHVVVKPEKGTTLVAIELEGEEREALAPLLNLLVEVFWREQRSETQRRLERERKFWAEKRRALGRDAIEEDAATIGDPKGNPPVGEDPVAKAALALAEWKSKKGSGAQRLELRSGFRRDQVVEGETKLRSLDEELVVARPDIEALVPDARQMADAAFAAAVGESKAPPTREQLATAARATDVAWLRALDPVEVEARALAEKGTPGRLESLAFVTADPVVTAATARWRGFVDARSELGAAEARKGVVAAVRDVVLRRTRELRILLGRRIELRDRLRNDDEDLDAQWQLSEELKALQGNFDALTTQLAKVDAELERIRAQISIENDARPLKVIEIATDPGRPVKPNRPLLLGLGAAVGLLLGLGVALLVDWLDDTVGGPEDVARHIGAPVLGSIIALRAGEADRVASEQPRSPVAEAFRSIRTSLEFATPVDATGGRVLLVSSCTPEEGKTTVASNLALVFAQDGKRTLIVDADLRRPRVHAVMGVDQARGLSNVLIGRERPEDVVLPTAHENLWVLPAGVAPPNPAELLGRPATRALFDALRASFDRIIVDTAPVGIVTDAAVLARLADTVILVIAAGRTKKRLAEHRSALLAAVGAPAAGVIVNRVTKAKHGAYGGYYGRGAGGYYGSGAKAPVASAGTEGGPRDGG